MFRSFWAANLVAALGALIQAVGAAWMMTDLSGSPGMVTLVQAAAATPIVLFSIIAGAIADNFARRWVMLIAQLILILSSLLLLAAAILGLLTPWSLLLLIFMVGTGTALHIPSWQASLTDMIPRSEVPAAVALSGLGLNVTRGIGPALGGMIVATLGVTAAFAVHSVTCLGVTAALLSWRPPANASFLPRESMGPAVWAGLRYVTMSPSLQAILLRSFTFGFGAVSVLALLPLLVRDQLGGDAVVYGLLFGSFGAGGIAGALLSGKIRDRFTSESSVRIASLGFACCAVGLAASPWPLLAAPALSLGGACWVVALTIFNISVQLSTPRWVVGRCLSVQHTASFGGQALGAWIWGFVATHLSTPSALLLAACAMVVSAAIGVGRWRLPALSSPNLDPNDRWREPSAAIEMVARSGPIEITIEYAIAETDVPRFLSLMEERSRRRRRDGARRWRLCRDVEQRDVWVESYQFPTWLDYVRYNKRVTLSDYERADEINRLHRGEQPPSIRRLLERPTQWQRPEPIDLN